jgi:hypothetical protein
LSWGVDQSRGTESGGWFEVVFSYVQVERRS